MLEQHPFGFFVPPHARYLMLGSFPGVQSCASSSKFDPSYDWFYRSKRSQFWKILEAVYATPLTTRDEQGALITTLGIALGDVIWSCRRIEGTNADTNLTDVTYSTTQVQTVLNNHGIERLYFTSSFVANIFRRHFTAVIDTHPDIPFVTLPSPSPRFARMPLREKIERYRTLLPNRT